MLLSLKILFKYKDLLYTLVSRDMKTRYRRSFLGYLWSVLNPLLMMAVLTLVFSYMFSSTIPNFPIYLLCGQAIFGFFSESTNMSMSSLTASGGLIKKVYLPKFIFPLSRTLSCFVNFGFSLIAMIIVLIVTRTPVNAALLFFPILLFYLFLFTLGVGLIMSVIAVFFRDIVPLYSVILAAWTYLTPIFYPVSILPPFAINLMTFNPLYHYVEFFRYIVLYGTIPSLAENLICLFMGVIALTIGLLIFRKHQNKFILYI